jgi:hypothetical protein
MNSKIKQFAELSKSYKTILVDGQMQSVLLIDPEKFAQMIVEECDRYARSTWEHGPLLGRDLLIHFGFIDEQNEKED